jgi:transposase
MVFETWLENCLRTTLKAGQVLVMDNATLDKGGRISQLIEDAGCQLLYLPPYSPDLNKIEQCWSWLKSRIRQQPDQFDCLLHATLECLAFCVRRRRARLLYIMLTWQWDVSIPDIIPHGNPVGIDIGLTNFVATSNGLLIEKTRFFALRRTQA